MDSPSYPAKVAFFNELYALDQDLDSDDDLDANKQEQIHRKTSRAFFESAVKPSPLPHPTLCLASGDGFPSPSRASSVPIPPTPTESQLKIIESTPVVKSGPGIKGHIPDLACLNSLPVEETPIPDSARPRHPALRRSATHPLAMQITANDGSPSMAPNLRKKRKRKLSPSTKTIPEAQQVLRGLSFYYIPNDDISPVRKARIARAVEYGALWTRALAGSTHVIVDKSLTYKDIERVLSSAPLASLIVVNEDYPINCIESRDILNPTQYRYRVPGCPLPLVQGAEASSVDSTQPTQSSAPSLVIKEPQRDSKKRNRLPPGDSPLRSIESSLLSGELVLGNTQRRNVSRSVEGNTNGQDAPAAVTSGPTGRASPELGSSNPRLPPHTLHPSNSQPDELTEYINLACQLKDLPLDEAEDEMQSTKDVNEVELDSGEEEGSGNEKSHRKRLARTSRKGQKNISFEDRFACNRGGTKNVSSSDVGNPNAKTIEVLQKMCDYYDRINDHWRTISYRKAIATLRRQTVKVSTEEEAYQLPNIGTRLAAKIEEIVTTSKLKRLEYANSEPMDRVLQTFLNIYDVGNSTANKWVAQGFRTLNDLREKADLTRNQRLGIEHYDDLNTRIPRREVTALGEYVKREAAAIDPRVELLVGGSYRRGADSSGDVDFIVTCKGTTSAGDLVPFLEALLAVLERKGFVVATLTALHSRSSSGNPGSKWHGCCVLPRDNSTVVGRTHDSGGDSSVDASRPIWRRVDFLLVPETEYGAALIYFTGNDIFNRSMRLLASKKGMRLNQRGLYKEVMRGPGRQKVTTGELVEGRDEKRIFEILGVKWREPWERWC